MGRAIASKPIINERSHFRPMSNQKLQLLTVPPFFHQLTVKADLNGITVLKDGRYKKRYVGSRQFEVDINGQLRTKRQLKELIHASDPPKKEGRPTKAPRHIKPMLNEVPKIEKKYTVNKPEIRARLYTMIAVQPPQTRELYFWTVTFPMHTDDLTIYRLFNTWLTKLRQKTLLKNYLWVAERQQNGTLHFHLAIPHKLPVKIANREMMICLVNACKAKEIDYSPYAARRYNGVDISKERYFDKTTKQWRRRKEATNFAQGKRGRRALVTYITKYITKNNSSFTHLAWHNSRGFSALFTGITFTYDESRTVYHWRFFCHSRPATQSEFFAFYPWLTDPPGTIVGELVKLNNHIQNLN